MQLSDFPTTHQLARRLLAMEDLPAVIPIDCGDEDGAWTAIPVDFEVMDGEGGSSAAVFFPTMEDE